MNQTPPFTLADTLRLVVPHWPGAVVASDALLPVFALAAELPPVDRALLECRLRGTSDRVDLSQAFVSEDLPVAQDWLDQQADSGQAWEAIESVFHQWGAPGSAVHGLPGSIWLEYDCHANDGIRLSLPALFVGPRKSALTEEGGDYPARLVAALAAALGAPAAPLRVSTALRTALASLPPGGHPSYAGFMLSRQPPSFRLHLRLPDPHQLDAVLERLELADPGGLIRDTAVLVGEAFGSVVLCLDWNPDISERTGLEFFVRDPNRLEDKLASLQGAGWLDDEQAGALSAWPGIDTPKTTATPWPDHLLVDDIRRGGAPSVLRRRVNHFKFNFAAGELLEVKVYLAVERVRVASKPVTE